MAHSAATNDKNISQRALRDTEKSKKTLRTLCLCERFSEKHIPIDSNNAFTL
jgi:hypothetical protein